MPDPVYLPRTMFIPGLQKITVTPMADGSIDVVGNFAAGTVNVTSGPLSFNPLALLTLFEDLATDLPKLFSDLQAVFATTPSVPSPTPVSIPPTH